MRMGLEQSTSLLVFIVVLNVVHTNPGLPPSWSSRSYGSYGTVVVKAPTRAPITAAPIAPPPKTAPPATAAPKTAPPVTAPPATVAPVTAPPKTEPPKTAPPVTAPPSTVAPVTVAPKTEPPKAPVTLPSIVPNPSPAGTLNLTCASPHLCSLNSGAAGYGQVSEGGTAEYGNGMQTTTDGSATRPRKRTRPPISSTTQDYATPEPSPWDY